MEIENNNKQNLSQIINQLTTIINEPKPPISVFRSIHSRSIRLRYQKNNKLKQIPLFPFILKLLNKTSLGLILMMKKQHKYFKQSRKLHSFTKK